MNVPEAGWQLRSFAPLHARGRAASTSGPIRGHKELPHHSPASQPRENRSAAHTSFIRAGLNWATRFPRRCCETVTALCRFTAHADFIPSSSFNTTSDGTPRIVEVTGATVTVDKYAMALFRVSTRAGRFLSGAANW